MVAINYAKDIRVGEQPVKAAALGSYFVWPPLPERLFFRGQSLAYDFVRQRYGVRLPDDAIDYTTNVNDLGIVTRASTATYWGPSGTLLEAAVDEARIQHDPVTGEALGMLVEREATNWVSNNTSFSLTSADFSSVDDTDPVMGSVVRVTAVAAGEHSTGYRMSFGGYPIPTGSLDASPGFLRVIYAKPITADYISLRFTSGPGGITVKLSTAEIEQSRDVPLALRYVKALAGGWVQIAFYQTSSATGQSGATSYRLLVGSNLKEITNGQGIEYAVGDEVLLAYPSMYQAVPEGPPQTIIPTIDSPVTRAADNAVIDLSDVFNPDEGTLRITAQVPEGGVVASLGDLEIVSDSSEFKEYDLNYRFHSGNTVAQLGEGIFNKVEYFPAIQGETALEYLIRTLYGNGEQGVMYIPEPKVLGQQVLWQDVEGTVPVVSDGDPVGLMLDLSGNGNHATQSTSAARPIYRTDGVLHWLAFDGVDDCLITAAIDFTGTNQKIAMLAVDKRGADGVFRAAIETSFNVNNQRGILLSAPSGDPSANYRVRVNAGSGAENISSPIGTFSGQTRNVISGIHAPGVVGTQLRVDGSIIASGSAANNDGSFESRQMSIGARTGSTNHFLGDQFGIVVVGEYANEDAVYAAESYLAALAGVTL